jgi:hypothetical protein
MVPSSPTAVKVSGLSIIAAKKAEFASLNSRPMLGGKLSLAVSDS